MRLFEAVGAGDLAAAQAAVAGGASVRAQDGDGDEPLHCACLGGHLDIAQWLHSEGAPVDGAFSDGEPLHRACSEGHLGVAQWLQREGASVNATDDNGITPLHKACIYGRLEIAQWLHRAGASLNATDKDGRTPLHLACAFGELETADWLCSAGADATFKDTDGNTPAQLLQRHARDSQLDQQALRSTLACLVRRSQAQGPLPSTAALVQARKLTLLRFACRWLDAAHPAGLGCRADP